MSLSPGQPGVDVLYAVYRQTQDGKYEPVIDSSGLGLQAAIQAADPYKQVELVADVSVQSALLKQYVAEALYDFAWGTFTINLPSAVESRWDPVFKIWVHVTTGAALAYEVFDNGAKSRLCLCVWTRDHVGEASEGA